MSPSKLISLFSQPWAIQPAAWRGLLHSLPEMAWPHARDLHRRTVERDAGPFPLASVSPSQPTSPPPPRGSALADIGTTPGAPAPSAKIGVLKLSGPIVKGLSAEECYYYGLCSIDSVHQAATEVAAKGINHLVLHLDSPGGMVCGVAEAAARLADLRASGVTLTAYTDTLACSAAYWLAAACDEIVAAPSAMVGSIGCICLCEDDSALWARFGVKPEYFVNAGSEAKLYGRSGLPWTDEARASFQASVDSVGAAFKDFVANRRPDLEREDMNGDAWDAASAPVGYVDHIAYTTPKGEARPISTIDDLLSILS